MAGSSELKIIISAINNAKEVFASVRKDVADMKQSVESADLGSFANVKKGIDDIKASSGDAKASLGQINEAGQLLINSLSRLQGVVGLLTGGFLALKSVQGIKDFADAAARAEVLGTVLHVVAANSAITADEIDNVDKRVQKLGVTAASSRQSIAQLLQSGLSKDFAAPLARAAQDLAVIAGENSSQTFSRLVVNIQQMDTMGLRWMGLMVDREQVLNKAAVEAGRALDENAKKTAFANAVLVEATKFAGTYEASMNNVGKQLTSLQRLTENYKVSLGDGLLPVYSELVKATSNIVLALTVFNNTIPEGSKAINVFGHEFSTSRGPIEALAAAIKSIGETLVNVVKFLTQYKEEVKSITSVVLTAAAGFVAFKATVASIGAAVAVLGPVFTTISAIISGITVLLAEVSLGTGVFAALAAGAATFGAALLPALPAIIAIGVALGAAYLVNKSLKKSNDDLKISYEEVNQRIDKYLDLLKTTQTQSIALSQKQQELGRLELQLVGETDAAKRANLQRQITDKQAELDKLNEAFKKAKQDLEDIQNKLSKNPGGEGQVFDLNRRRDVIVKEQEAELARQKAVQATTAAYLALGVTFDTTTPQAVIRTKQLSEELSNLSQIIAQLGTKEFPASLDNIDFILKSIGSRVKSIGSQGDLEAVQKEIKEANASLDRARNDTNARDIDGRKRALAVQSQEADRIRKFQVQAELAGGEEVLNRNKSVRAAQIQNLKTHVEGEIALQRARVSEDQKILDDEYARGLQTTEGYFENRRSIINQNYALDVAAAKNNLVALQQELANTNGPNDDARRVSLKAQIKELTDDLAATGKIRQNYNFQIADSQRQQEAASRAEAKAVRDLRLEVQRGIDSEGAEIEALKNKYEDFFKTNKISAAQQKELGVLRDQQIERLKIQNRLSAELAAVEVRLAEVTLLRAKVDLATNDGVLTSIEAQNALYRISAQELDALAEKQEVLRKKIEELNKQPNTDANQTLLSGLRKELTDVNTQIVTVAKSMRGLADDIRDKFTTAIEGFLNSLSDRSKSIFQKLKDAANAFAKDITSVLTKDLAQQFTRYVVDITKDSNGKSIFDSIAAVLGGEKNKSPLGTETDPMFVKLKDGIDIGKPKGPIDDTYDPNVKQAGDTLFNRIFDGVNKKFGGIFTTMKDSFKSIFDTLASTFSQIFGTIQSLLVASTSSNGGGGFWGLIAQAFGVKNVSSGGDALQTGVGSLSSPYAEGGLVSGPGTSTSDSIAGRLSDGEYVLRAAAVKTLGVGFLDRLNGLQSIARPYRTAFADGGLVMAGGGPSWHRPSVTVVQNITTPNPYEFRKSRTQINADMAFAAGNAARRIR